MGFENKKFNFSEWKFGIKALFRFLTRFNIKKKLLKYGEIKITIKTS